MDTEKVAALTLRALNIKELMERAERRGSDVHEMDNIRHCATSVLELLSCDTAEAVQLAGLISSLERRTVELFKKRYAPTASAPK
jgi:hypothetical protein